MYLKVYHLSERYDRPSGARNATFGNALCLSFFSILRRSLAPGFAWGFCLRSGLVCCLGFFLLFVLGFWLHHTACRILVPQPGIKPMQWKQGFLTTRPPGKSLFFYLTICSGITLCCSMEIFLYYRYLSITAFAWFHDWSTISYSTTLHRYGGCF